MRKAFELSGTPLATAGLSQEPTRGTSHESQAPSGPRRVPGVRRPHPARAADCPAALPARRVGNLRGQPAHRADPGTTAGSGRDRTADRRQRGRRTLRVAGSEYTLRPARRRGALVKTAVDAQSDRRLAREARWLRELETVQELDGQVPRLIDEGISAEGRRYLVLDVPPGLDDGTGRAFGRGHASFLHPRQGALPRHRLRGFGLRPLAGKRA